MFFCNKRQTMITCARYIEDDQIAPLSDMHILEELKAIGLQDAIATKKAEARRWKYVLASTKDLSPEKWEKKAAVAFQKIVPYLTELQQLVETKQYKVVFWMATSNQTPVPPVALSPVILETINALHATVKRD